MDNVAIVGVGMHPFGRFPGKSAVTMGAAAVRDTLADTGATWTDVQFAFGGSYEVDNPDTVVTLLGPTGIPFTNVYNGCATAASSIDLAAKMIAFGAYDVGIAVGMDKHPARAFSADPIEYALPAWYGQAGHFMTTKYFGMKINRYMHDHAISHSTLAKVAAKAFRNGALNPNAFRRKPLTEEQILESPILNYPLRHYMFCAPDEGAAAVLLCRADIADRFTSTPLFVRATAVRTRQAGAFEVHGTWATTPVIDGPTVQASRAAFELAAIGPDEVDVVQLQDTDAGAEVIHMAENGFCADGEQEELLARGETEINGRLPINTDGGLLANGEPVGASGLRQVFELAQQLRGTAGDRQVPGNPRVGYAQLYGAPGTAGVTIIST